MFCNVRGILTLPTLTIGEVGNCFAGEQRACSCLSLVLVVVFCGQLAKATDGQQSEQSDTRSMQEQTYGRASNTAQ
eukprot:4081544-Amphidinium_carterae.1